MNLALLDDLFRNNTPVRIETASRSFDVPHSDFVSYSPSRTSISIFFEEDGQDRIAIVPLRSITAVVANAN